MAAASIVSIFLAPRRGEPMREVELVRAVAGRGLEGDRYFRADPRTASARKECSVTLIEAEALAGLWRDHDLRLEPAESRRNLVTVGVDLNHLVGREFRVGDVVLGGIRLCEPCLHLQRITRPGILSGLVHQGGLKAEIVRGGVIRRGDPVTPHMPGPPAPVAQ